MAYLEAALKAIRRICQTTWGLTSGFQAAMSSQFFWREFLSRTDGSQKALELPFYVVQYGKERDHPMAYTQRGVVVPILVFYVRGIELTGGEVAAGHLHAETVIASRLEDLRKAVAAYTGPEFGLVDRSGLVDTSESNGANDQFTVRGDPFWAGSLYVEALVQTEEV